LMLLSRELTVRLKLAPRPMYTYARIAGLQPSTLSRFVHGGDVRPAHTERIVKIGGMLGLSTAAECLESAAQQ